MSSSIFNRNCPRSTAAELNSLRLMLKDALTTAKGASDEGAFRPSENPITTPSAGL